jgi:hypothetical protein
VGARGQDDSWYWCRFASSTLCLALLLFVSLGYGFFPTIINTLVEVPGSTGRGAARFRFGSAGLIPAANPPFRAIPALMYAGSIGSDVALSASSVSVDWTPTYMPDRVVIGTAKSFEMVSSISAKEFCGDGLIRVHPAFANILSICTSKSIDSWSWKQPTTVYSVLGNAFRASVRSEAFVKDLGVLIRPNSTSALAARCKASAKCDSASLARVKAFDAEASALFASASAFPREASAFPALAPASVAVIRAFVAAVCALPASVSALPRDVRRLVLA